MFFSDFSNRIQPHYGNEVTEGNCLFNIAFDTKSYQLQKNIKSKDIGIYSYNGSIDFFILNDENFIKYMSGRKFKCFYHIEDNKTNINPQLLLLLAGSSGYMHCQILFSTLAIV